MKREYRYECLFPNQLRERIAGMPVVFVPTGLLEWHANHLPLGQDALKAHGICLKAAERLGGGVVMPPNYFGTPGYSTYLGTLTFSEACLEPLFLEYLEQLVKVGFKVIMLLTGHYGKTQVDFINGVAAKFRARNPDITLFARPEYEGVTVDGEAPGDHAGKWETSMFWYLHEELIDMASYDTVIDDMKTYPDARLDYYKEPARWDFRSDVRQASSKALGKKAVDAIVDLMMQDVKGALM